MSFLFDETAPYLVESEFMSGFLKKLCTPSKPVRHEQTCPVCGRKRVNIYRRDSEWKCLKCWQSQEGEAE